MIKPAVRRWQINLQARLVLLQSGDSYTSFINKLKSEKISLPPHNPRQRQQTLATSSTNTNDSSTTVGRPFVPPICAPAQTRDIPVSTAASMMKWGSEFIGQSAKRIVVTVVGIAKIFAERMVLMVLKRHHQRNNCNNK